MPTVLLTRPEPQNEPLRQALEKTGMTVWTQPTIAIEPPESWEVVDRVLHAMLLGEDTFDWIVFSSGNGIDFFFNRIETLQKAAGCDGGVEFLSPARIAVVGEGTDAVLRRRMGRRADLVPETFAAEGILEHLLPVAGGKRFLLLRASRGRDILRRSLLEAGGAVTELVVYRSVDVEQAETAILAKMERGEFDWTTATSSSIARSLVRLFGERLKRTRIVSISPMTSGVLYELGYPSALEAREASMSGIVDALAIVYRQGQAVSKNNVPKNKVQKSSLLK